MMPIKQISGASSHFFSYSAYGYGASDRANAFLGFAGEPRDPFTGLYLLGLGHRAYSPTLMRFQSPDQLSPFGAGGRNCYSYCLGDPVNNVDPTGRISKTVQIPRKSPDILRQLLNRSLHGSRVRPSVRAVDIADMKSYVSASEVQIRPDIYQRVTEAAMTVLERPHGDIPQVGLLQADSKFLEDTVFVYARQESAQREHQRLMLETLVANQKQLGIERFTVIAKRRLDFLQGQGEMDPGDPAYSEVIGVVKRIRI